MKKIMKITKRIFAIQAEVPAMPAKPKTPAMMAITRNNMAHDNIWYLPYRFSEKKTLYAGMEQPVSESASML